MATLGKYIYCTISARCVFEDDSDVFNCITDFGFIMQNGFFSPLKILYLHLVTYDDFSKLPDI